MLEPRSTPTLDREVAQKHAHGRQHHPGRVAPVLPTPRLDEIAETARRISLRVVPEEADEVPHIASIRGQRALDDAAVDAHPLEEPLDQSDGLAWGLDARDDAPLVEMLNESTDTREDLSGAIS